MSIMFLKFEPTFVKVLSESHHALVHRRGSRAGDPLYDVVMGHRLENAITLSSVEKDTIS